MFCCWLRLPSPLAKQPVESPVPISHKQLTLGLANGYYVALQNKNTRYFDRNYSCTDAPDRDGRKSDGQRVKRAVATIAGRQRRGGVSHSHVRVTRTDTRGRTGLCIFEYMQSIIRPHSEHSSIPGLLLYKFAQCTTDIYQYPFIIIH
jgi:hypothetical protein